MNERYKKTKKSTKKKKPRTNSMSSALESPKK